jgi:hypothetical protein
VSDSDPSALFEQVADTTYQPTMAAIGPWSKEHLHGGAVAALFAGRLAPVERTLVRLSVDFVRPVPRAALELTIGEPVGGSRVQRSEATLFADGRPVATARAVSVRRAVMTLPPGADAHAIKFSRAGAPSLDEPDPRGAKAVGWAGFVTLATATRAEHPTDGTDSRLWIRLLLPVVEGTAVTGTEQAAVAADYAQVATSTRLPFAEWSFVNSELTMHLAREPQGQWVAIACDAVVADVGAGFTSAELHDCEGRFGQSTSALFLEPRVGQARG